jgi:GntR family transcriptional regulator/MocR family aminotransferase
VLKHVNVALDLVGLELDRVTDLPMHRQIYNHIRSMIIDGRLPPRTKLPSSRSLARMLGCSRMTTATAYALLEAEGYLDGLVGSGTYVADVLPDFQVARNAAAKAGQPPPPCTLVSLSRRGQGLAMSAPDWAASSAAFTPGLPDANAFPFELWARLLRRGWERPQRWLLSQSDPAGLPALREAISAQLRALRGLQCGPEEIIITSGTTNALDILARLLLDVGDTAWVEDPGYPDVIHTLRAAGVDCIPVPVDDEGIDVAFGLRNAPAAKVAWVTPSHQWPLGVAMSPRRRLALLEWARQADAVIIEDDYDSEFRYSGSPLTSLRALDDSGRVIYLGSFSKTCFPSMRLGYMVVPPHLFEPMVRARQPLDYHTSYALQPAMAAFIAEGHYDAHIRRMRKRYRARQLALMAAAERHLGGLLRIQPAQTGMAVVARFEPGLSKRCSEQEVAARARSIGLTLAPLSSFCVAPLDFKAVVMGYAPIPAEQIDQAMARLARCLG